MTTTIAAALLGALAADPTEAVSAVDVGNGIGIALAGMVTVFVGLVALTVLLPVLRKLVERGSGAGESTAEEPAAGSRGLSAAEVAAIGVAIHAHLCMQDEAENMELTWQDHDKPYTPWRFAGRAEHLSGLETVQSRIRSR